MVKECERRHETGRGKKNSRDGDGVVMDRHSRGTR